MKCSEPDCQGALRPEDQHCPRCGRAVDQQLAAPPPPAGRAQFHVSSDSAPRTPIPEAGEAYPVLRQRAQAAILAATVLRWTVTGLGGFLFLVSCWAGLARGDLFLGFLWGLAFLAVGAVVGWMLWLKYAVFGEMIYLVLDLAAIFRRK